MHSKNLFESLWTFKKLCLNYLGFKWDHCDSSKFNWEISLKFLLIFILKCSIFCILFSSRGKSHLFSLFKLFSKTSYALQWEEESLYRLLETYLNYFEVCGSEIFRIHRKLFVFLCMCLWIWRRIWSPPFWRTVLDESSTFTISPLGFENFEVCKEIVPISKSLEALRNLRSFESLPQ